MGAGDRTVAGMPRIGMGTAVQGPKPDPIRRAVLRAIEIGYRHFDTAAHYETEAPIGEAAAEAVRSGAVASRDDLFITSKLWCSDAHGDRVVPALRHTLRNLQMEYVDLYLVHWPVSMKPGRFKAPFTAEDFVPFDMRAVWEAMEECHRLGLAKAIGVANFSCKKLDTLLSFATIPPAVNQVEVNPVWQQRKLREFCRGKGIQLCAYSPLGAKGTHWGSDAVMDAGVLQDIAASRGKSVAQVCLRWVYASSRKLPPAASSKERGIHLPRAEAHAPPSHQPPPRRAAHPLTTTAMAAAMSVSAVVPPAAAVARARTLICVPATARAPRDMAAEVAAAAALGADLAELRLDRLAGFAPRRDLPALLAKPRTLPTLVTYRPKWEGGEYEGDDEPRFEALQLAMELGAEYVDIELKVADKFIKFMSGKKPENCKLIVSSHNYDNTPSAEELASLLAQIQATGADIVKIATTATEIVDVSRMFQILVHCQEKQVPIIGLVMNDRGFISRVLCPKFGGYLTFGSLEKGKESAAAQPTAADLINVYNIRQIGPDTKVFGIIGNPVGHSKSPILHNEAFRSVGLHAVYVPFLVDDLAKFLSTYSSPDFAGFSCTIPHKEAAVRCCDEVDPIARDIGAVNTIIRKPDGKLVGYNTDYVGAISAIEDGIRATQPTHSTTSPLAGRLFVVIGAGGAGKALAYGAKEKGARVVIANRTFARAQELGNLIGGPALTLAELENYHPEEGMILANTTAIGMHPNVNETPLSKQALKSYAVVFDAVYTPKETRLLREAAECGATVVSGLEMFIRQAMGQFEHFTGMPAPDSLMRDIVLRKT